MATPSIPPSVTAVPSGFKVSGGNIAFDDQYFYVNYNGWRRFPFAQTSNLGFSFPDPSNNGDIYCDNEYFYIVIHYKWQRLPIFVIKPKLPIGGKVPVINIQNTKLSTFPKSTDQYGRWGMIAFNDEYFCIWGQGKWHKIPIAAMPSSTAAAISLIPSTFDFLRVTEPASVYTKPALNISFSVSASSLVQPITFQWYSGSLSQYIVLSDGGQISGSQEPTLYISASTFQNSGSYFVEVNTPTKGFHFTSSIVNLIILPPVILSQPVLQTNYTTDLDIFDDLPDQNFFTASFSVTSYGGNVPLTYQWYSGSTPLVDDDRITGSFLINGYSSSLQINCLNSNDAGPYYVEISNGLITTSNHVLLTVLDNTVPTYYSESIGQSTSLLFGNIATFINPYVEGTVPVIGVSFLTGSIFNSYVPQYGGNDSASAVLGFESGYIFNTVIPFYVTGESQDAASGSVYNVGFESGYIINSLIVITSSFNESSSYGVGFESGSVITVVIPLSSPESYNIATTFGLSLLTGSVT